MLVGRQALASIVLVILALGNALPVAAADDWQAGNLVANGGFAKGRPGELPEGWTVAAPNPVLRPKVQLVAGEGESPLLMAEGNGRKECFGIVKHPVSLAAGKTYRLRVRFRFEGFDDVNRHLVHGVFAGGFNNGIFEYRKEGPWVIGENRFPGPAAAAAGELRLYFRYSPQGRVWWSAVSLQECEPVRPRPVKIAVCSGGGDRKRWEKFLDTAGQKRCDVALMGEFFEPGVHAPDGPTMQFMAAKARQWKMYVSGTLRLKRGDLIYNFRQGRDHDLLRQLAPLGGEAPGVEGGGSDPLPKCRLLHAVDARPGGGQRRGDRGQQRQPVRGVGRRGKPGGRGEPRPDPLRPHGHRRLRER